MAAFFNEAYADISFAVFDVYVYEANADLSCEAADVAFMWRCFEEHVFLAVFDGAMIHLQIH